MLTIVALIVVAVPLSLYALWGTHLLLGRLSVMHARRYCRRGGLTPSRSRWQPEFESSGKTEYTLVQLECLDARRQRRLVVLSVWPFGIRKLVSDQAYPDAYDVQWPRVAS